MAFLAKQGWRLLTHPESLCARIFKAKYYPKSSFTQASLGSQPSYTWRSILKGRPILEKGICWRVGNGQSINIWNDNWISTQCYRKPLIRTNVLPSELVECLIDPVHRCWNINAINAAFLPSEVSSILCIPISYRLPEDILFWSFTKNGVYSVKSGYQQAEAIRRCGEGSSSSVNDKSKIWKIIWHSGVPSKVKIFCWRAVHNVVPTFNELLKKGTNVCDCCCFCGCIGETISHILCFCPTAKETWKLLNSNPRFDKLFLNSIDTWILDVYSIADTQSFNLFLLTIWMLWFNRNRKIHGDQPIAAPTLKEKIYELHHEYKCNHAQQIQNQLCPLPSVSTWSPPLGNGFKMNCDAAVDMDRTMCSLGIVIRNAAGQPMVSACCPNITCATVDMVEGLAILFGLRIAVDCHLLHLEVESDSLSIINTLRNLSPWRNDLGLICEDIYSFAPSFSSLSFNHVKREANNLAHNIAQYASQIDCCQIFMESLPPSCYFILYKDGCC